MSLNKDYVKLKSKYREIFFQCLEEAKSTDNLVNVWHNEIKSALKSINTERAACHCGGCGVCCRFAVSEFSPAELELKAKNGDKYAFQFIQTFVPYSSINEAREIYPEYVEFLEKNTDGVFYIYYCPKVTDDNKCPDYENRPQICRDFPEVSGFFLPKTCSFTVWKLKSQSVWLKINAMAEIMNFMKKDL